MVTLRYKNVFIGHCNNMFMFMLLCLCLCHDMFIGYKVMLMFMGYKPMFMGYKHVYV